ncbi:hypothetical protein F5Y19DRAFT_99967 [Xylariaceae sp. FL1651]|nr:hypothetical protein F5Y19DRAFT_99967 [Xylariaceae sp. FL1651]
MFRRKLFSSSRDRSSSETAGETDSRYSVERSKSVETSSTAVPSVNYLSSDEANTPGLLTRRPRLTSAPSAPSTISSTGSKPRAPSRADDPHGLTLIHVPEGEPSADIIFIHGLGGSSRLTWSKNHDLDLFWPLKWLPNDHDVGQARIFTFGYNADFHASSQSSNLGITDFAKNLLFDMLYGRDQSGFSISLGQAPLIIVAHSMGGLVFKKAYLEAQLDDRYSKITQSIKAVIFLATPHRGADLADILNKLLSISFRNSSKQYVAELGKHGPFLKSINEQFRHLATRLQIFSFYETLRTSMGLSSSMVLDEDSAKLGYPGEISRSLNADHHDVCKFESPDDPNYRAILAAMKSLVSSHSRTSTQSAEAEMSKVRGLLSISDNYEHDLAHFLGRRTEGTCEWILEHPKFGSWLSSSTSNLLWLHGRPARGKSVLSSFLVSNLRDTGAAVQHFFFRTGDETKRSITALLKSLAFQIAAQLPAFRKALASFADGGYKPKEADWKSMWKKVFVSLLFPIELRPPFYWIIDGLDESASSQQVFELLAEVKSSTIPIHILITSRINPGLFTSFARLGSKMSTASASIDRDVTDIRIYVEEELRYIGWDDQIKEEIMTKVLNQANDNFLWVHLILEEIKECHTDDDVRDALVELPPGMESLYQKMEDSITRIRKPSDRNLSRQLLLWAIYSRRSITIEELSAILEPDFGHILDMPSTINRLCGHFLVIEGGNQIGLLHQTAREYLTTTKTLPFSLASSDAHLDIFQKSISTFFDKSLRSSLHSMGPGFLQYRATSWMHHLKYLGLADESDELLNLLLKFFKEPSILTWIQALASLGQLKTLIEASYCLATFVKRKRKIDVTREASLRRFEDLELLEVWTRDLLKLPGRFGSSLSQDPTCIHYCVAPFCPRSSAIHRAFGHAVSSPIVQGLSEDWDDCLARVSVGSDEQASLLASSWKYLAVVSNSGRVLLWDCTTFHRTLTWEHGEMISAICFNSTGDRIATYGSATTKVWSCQTGNILHLVNNPPGMQALCLEFVESDTALMLGSDRRCVLRVALENESEGWAVTDSSLLNSVESLEGTYLNSPTALVMSPDHTKIAAAYRRFPLMIWSLDSAKVIKRVSREYKQGRTSDASPFVEQVSWHHNSEDLIGFFVDGHIFKLNIVDGTYQEQPPDPGQWPSIIRFSPDGSVYAICSVHGTIKLYDFQTSALIYQLTSESMVTSFAFSQDGRRFYDIRGSSCQIWEPNSLVRLAVEDDKPVSSHTPDESVDQSNYPSEMFADNPVPVDIIAPMPGHAVVAFGDDEGLVALLDLDTRKRIQVDRIATGLSIEHLVWSEDGRYLIYAEVSERLTFVQIDSTPSGWKCRRIARFKPKHEAGGILQLILMADSKYVLVVYHGSTQLWSLAPVSLREHQVATSYVGSQWVPHPLSPQNTLAFTPYSCVVLDSSRMTEVSKWKLDTLETPKAHDGARKEWELGQQVDSNLQSSSILESVESVLVTHLKGHILVTISRRLPSRGISYRFVVVDFSVDSEKSNNISSMKSVSVPSDVGNLVIRPLNILENQHFVFLDKSYGVCTWNLKSSRGADAVTRHFFIPRDLISEQSLGLLYMTSSGSILCPHKGDIIVIDTSIGSKW